MQYLGSDYSLKEVAQDLYRKSSKRFALIQQRRGLKETLEVVTKDEDSKLADLLFVYADELQSSYGNGGGFYSLAVGVGISALRKVNPISKVPEIGMADWDSFVVRHDALQAQPGITTLESIGGVGLLEVQDVNPGYVDGYQEVMGTPALSPYLGFTGMGTLHAHDLLHFASQRG